MPYTPDATDVTNPIAGTVKAATAPAEFIAIKLYMRDVLLAGINSKAPIASPIFTGADGANVVTATGTTVGGSISLRPDGTNGNALRWGGSGPQAGTLRLLGPGDAERIRVDSVGNVGLGTNAPASRLHAAGDIRLDGRVIQQRSTGSAYLVSMTFADTLGGAKTDNLSIGNDGGGALLFHTNSAEKMRIDSGGNVGLGTIPLAARLHVASATNIWARFEASVVTSSFMTFLQGGSASPLGFLGSDGAAAVSGGTGTHLALRAENDLMLAAGGNVERLRVKASGGVVFVPTGAPASPQLGEVYYDSATNKHYGYNGTWNAFY